MILRNIIEIYLKENSPIFLRFRETITGTRVNLRDPRDRQRSASDGTGNGDRALFIRTICRLHRDRRWDMTLRYRISIHLSIILFRVQWDSPEKFLFARHVSCIRSLFVRFPSLLSYGVLVIHSPNIFSRGIIRFLLGKWTNFPRLLITILKILIG